jgi:hypothetical protein
MVKVTISGTLADWWGADDLIADLTEMGFSAEEIEAAIFDTIQEDLFAFTEEATWKIEVVSDDDKEV